MAQGENAGGAHPGDETKNTSIPFTDCQTRFFHTMGPQDSRMPDTIRPQSDIDASSVSDYYIPLAAEQHHYTAYSLGPRNTNAYMYCANSTHSRTPVATGEEAYFFTSSVTAGVDSAAGLSAVYDMELSQTSMPPAPQSANAPISPFSPLSPASPISPFTPLTPLTVSGGVDYFSGDGFVSQDVWTGTEINTEINPDTGHDHPFFSPLLADSLSIAAPPGAMAPPPRSRRRWPLTSNTGFPTQTTTQRQRRIGPKSPKAARPIARRRQHEDVPAYGGGISDGCSSGGGVGGDGNESAADAVKEGRIRRTHNLVEKQYRNRLNAQFERLLAVLPARYETDEEEQGRGDDVPDKTISKAEVLGMATQRIKMLEQQNRELLAHQDQLMWDLETASGAAATTTGCMNPMRAQQPPY
ncbi:hypothetical protein QBC34DRAFT_402897 [Podospora aff. communis PSN243]|uniref:BHLH domain-containing protein n=1 Tax=Podospora aff. communis PSN243 TaxID=3040156 RepID=A0AAV9GRK7_9PEZI|nr:hypothetical protein QBC34DRAFT_402897 [Podospora aff. communis PSN243]